MNRSPMTRLALATAALLALGACATQDLAGPAGWKVEPVLQVRHSAAAAEAYYRMGRYYEGMQRWSDALQAYGKATEADPGNAEAWNALGVAQARAGRLVLAEEQLRRALALAPQRADLRSNLGYVLLLAGRSDESIAELRAALALDAANPVTQDNLRLALDRTNAMLSEAIAAAEPAPAAASAVAAPAAAPTPAAAPPASLQVIDTPTLAAWSDRPAAAPLPAERTPARLEISNGMGKAGAADHLRHWLTGHGIAVQRLSNTKPYTQAATVIQYREGYGDDALRLARLLPVEVAMHPVVGLHGELRVLLGRDWVRAVACLDIGRCAEQRLQMAAAGTTRP